MTSPRRNDYLLLAAMAIGHAVNDFSIGITGSMIPTLEAKFSLSLGAIAGIVGIMGFMGNVSQPIAGFFIDRSRTAAILLLTPVCTGASLLVGFTDTWSQATLLFFLAGISFGVFHPLAFLLARSTLVGRPALATAIYISFGFLGVSSGSWVAGAWLEQRGLEAFYLFYLLPMLMVLFYFMRGIHRLELAPYRTHANEPRPRRMSERNGDAGSAQVAHEDTVPFALLYFIGLLLGIEGGSLVFFTPKLFHVLYDSEGLGGRAVFFLGLTGGLASYGYAVLVDRGNPFRVILVAQLLGIFPLFGFFYFPDPGMKTVMLVLFGLTAGAVYSPLASLAPTSRGLSVGMRSALMFGGVWGLVVVLHWGMANIADTELTLETVVGWIRAIPFILLPVLFYASRRYVH